MSGVELGKYKRDNVKIIIVKISAIGDVVVSLGVSTYIREKHPQATITWVCGKVIAPIIKATNAADELIIVNENNLLKGNFFKKSIELFKIWKRLFLRKFDLVIIGHTDFRYRLLVFPVWTGKTRIFRKTGRCIPIAERYHGDEYLRLFTDVDNFQMLSTRLPKLEISLPSVLQQKISRKSEFKKPIIVLAPGGAKNILRDDSLRRWSIQNYINLAKRLIADDYQIVLIGGKEDDWVSSKFKDLEIIDIIGQTSLLDIVALFSVSNLLITHDSGPMHLAKLTNIPVIALFGPTNPNGRVSRYCRNFVLTDKIIENIHFIWGGKNLPCCPCYDGKNYANCANNVCINSITVDEVYIFGVDIIKAPKKTEEYYNFRGSLFDIKPLSNITVNTRCLRRSLTGLQRYTLEVLHHFPKEVTQKLLPVDVSKNIITSNLWEQFILPLGLKGDLLWSPANVGPILYKNQVLTIHDVMPIEPNYDNHVNFSYFFSHWYRYMLPRLAANVRHIITLSNFSADRIMHLLGVNANKISIIPNGIDHQKFYPRSESEIQEFINKKGLPGSKYILSLSSILPHKNFQSILDAWKLLSGSLPKDVYLFIAGGIPKYGGYSMSNMPPRVHYLGYVEDEYLPILYSGAMFFVFLSLYEGFGLPPLEAMACGTPVLASDIASMSEVVGGAGIKVNPLSISDIAENIKLMVSDAELRKELSDKGIENAMLYDWNKTSSQVWQILNNFV